MSSWAFIDFARQELLERQQLRLPPTSRIAAISGPEKQVRTALDVIQRISSVRVLGTESQGDRGFKATITCDFRHNDEVATALRARIIAEATTGPRSRGRGNGDQRVVKLRVRFDETSINS
jgi:primosomal protein N' (replication factor Y)